jgi:hypothetical protein
MTSRHIVLGALILALAAAPAAAQGRGKKLGQGRKTPSSAPAPSSTTASGGAGAVAADSVAAFNRQFGSWLDDASLLQPAEGWLAVSVGHSRSSFGNQTDFPVVDAAVGLTSRAQFGATVPYYRLHFPDGYEYGGLGDIYLTGKVQLIDPELTVSGIGVAAGPVIEVLSDPDPRTGSRWFWGAPVSVEFRSTSYRVYGSTGYFSRGAFFTSGAVEVPLSPRVVGTAALIHMRSLNGDAEADAIGAAKTRVDIAGALAYLLTDSVAAFGSLGRSLTAPGDTGTSFAVNGGISIRLTR